ncbi:MAG: hypothetical protein SGPRY_003916 [Prymnesium sp.]
MPPRNTLQPLESHPQEVLEARSLLRPHPHLRRNVDLLMVLMDDAYYGQFFNDSFDFHCRALQGRWVGCCGQSGSGCIWSSTSRPSTVARSIAGCCAYCLPMGNGYRLPARSAVLDSTSVLRAGEPTTPRLCIFKQAGFVDLTPTLYLRDVFVWLPELSFGATPLQCPSCGTSE